MEGHIIIMPITRAHPVVISAGAAALVVVMGEEGSTGAVQCFSTSAHPPVTSGPHHLIWQVPLPVLCARTVPTCSFLPTAPQEWTSAASTAGEDIVELLVVG